MSQKMFRKSAIALAIAGAMASGGAYAITAANTATGSTFDLQAPFTNAFQAGYGKRVRIQVTRDGATADQDNMRLYAFLYQNGSYVGTVRSSTPSGGGQQTLDQTVVLPDSSIPYNEVTFAYLTEDSNADDTWDSAAAADTVLKVEPNTFTTRDNTTAGDGLSVVDVSTATYTVISAATNAELAAIGALADMKANAITVNNYAGPTLLSAQTDNLLNGTDIKLTFDAALKAIADNNASSVGAGDTVITVAGNPVTTAVVNGAVADGDYVVRFDDNSAAFSGAISTVENKLVIGNDCSAANLISDEAGNCPAPLTKTVTVFAEPKFAAAGTAKVLVTGGVITTSNVDDLYTSAGLTVTTSDTLTLTVRMDEDFDAAGVDSVDDINVSTTDWTPSIVSGTGANTNVFTLTLTPNNNGVLKLDANGNLTFDGTEVKLGLAVGNTALSTAENKALTAAVAPVNVKVGVAPAAPVVKTADADADGTLDGVHIKLGAPVTTPLASPAGAKLVDRDNTGTEAASTVSVNSADTTGSTIDVIANDQATIVGFLTGSETQAVNLGTAATSATPIPYDVSVSSSSITYKHNYKASDGNLRTIPDIALAGTIGDGAAPVLLNVTRLTTSATEGTLNLVFSEPLDTASAPETGDTEANGSSLILLAANANDDNIASATPPLGTLGQAAFTQTTVANDTATFYNVDQSLLSALTSVGVTAGNTTFIGNDNNVISAQSKAPSALTADTATAPSFEKAVAVESSTGFIKTVLLTLTEPVTANGSNKASDFTVTLGGIDIPASTVSVSGKVLTITLPGEGIRRDLVKRTDLNYIHYANSSATSDYRDSDNNKLANFSDETLDVPQNSQEIYVQEISATLTTDGSTQVAQGTMVRADLIKIASGATTTFKRGDITVPCGDCSGKTMNIALEDEYSAISTDIEAALKEGKKTIPVIVEVQTNANRGNNYSKHAVLKSGAPAGIDIARKGSGLNGTDGAMADNTISYNANLDVKTGVISGQVKGQVTFSQSAPGSMSILDTTYQTVANGKIRMSVGVTDAEKAALTGDNAFVLVSVKQPADAEWTLVTSPVPSFNNYLPFKDELSTSGTIAGALGTVDLSKIETIEVANTNVWQLLAVNGEISQDTNKDLDVDRFFITIDPATGAPITRWHADGFDGDMAFTLKDSKVDTAFEASQKTVSKIGLLNGGDGLALQNIGSTANNDKIFVPVTGNDAKRSIKKGWQLMTAVVDIPEANFSASNIEAVIKVGGDNDAQSWFSGAANNQLNMMKSDTAYFVYFGSDTADFKFGK